MTPVTVCGIDPGVRGGVAVVREGRVIFADRLASHAFKAGSRDRQATCGAELARVFAEHDPDAVYLELGHARTSRGRRGEEGGERGDSAPTAFSFGHNWGVAFDRAAECRKLVIVSSRTWQRSMLVYGSPTRENTKSASIGFIKTFHDYVDLAPGLLREPNDGIADAAVIALFGEIQETGPCPPPGVFGGPGAVPGHKPRTVRRPAPGRRRARRGA